MSDFPQVSMWERRALPKPVRADFDSATIGVDGVTGARPVQAMDGIHYIAKNDGWNPDITGDTHVLLQEWICARLAERVGVPIPEYCLLDIGGEICFGSQLLPVAYSRFSSSLAGRIMNPDDIYHIAVFDTWVSNTDRHPGNLLVVNDSSHLRLVAIDHSHCPIFGTSKVESLNSVKDSSARETVKPYLRGLITDRTKLARTIAKVQNLSDGEVREITATPSCLGAEASTLSCIQNFLLYRRERLKQMFNRSMDLFPAISEQAL